VIYTLLVDEHSSDVTREAERKHIDRQLLAPLDPAEREQYERDNWGVDESNEEAQADAWGDVMGAP
jgi:hypothetical protein